MQVLIDKVIKALCDADNNVIRLFHGRGGILPNHKHLAVDWYAPAVFITLYEDKENSEEVITLLNSYLSKEAKVKCLAIQRRFLLKAPVEIKWGDLPERAYESGLEFMLSLDRNQNHGFFPDMQPGREWLRLHADGKRILNLFSYTCALSVAAVAGGAEKVVNLDLSSRALAIGRENHRLNFDQTQCEKVTYLPHNLFKSWGRLKRLAPFDIVVLDPPSHQPGSFIAEKDYPRLIRRLSEVLNHEGAEVMACLNAPELDETFLTGNFAEYLPNAKLKSRLPTPQGYIEAGEGWGLKRLIYSIG